MKEVGSKLPTHGNWCVKLLPTSDVKIGDPAYCIIKADRDADKINEFKCCLSAD